MFCNVGFAKTYQNQIFGIKINDHINKYIEECDIGETFLKTDECTSLLSKEFELSPENTKYINATFLRKLTNKSIDEKIYKIYKIKLNWIKNSIFTNYSVYVDKNFKIVSIAGVTELYEQNLSEFENKCRNKKKNLVKRISELHDIPLNKYSDHTYQFTSTKKNGQISVDSKKLEYLVKDIPVSLQIYCSYTVNKDYTEVKSRLVYKLITDQFQKFTDENYAKKGYTKKILKKLNDQDIISNNNGL